MLKSLVIATNFLLFSSLVFASEKNETQNEICIYEGAKFSAGATIKMGDEIRYCHEKIWVKSICKEGSKFYKEQDQIKKNNIIKKCINGNWQNSDV